MNFIIGKYLHLLIYCIGIPISFWTLNSRAQTNSNNPCRESAAELNQSIIWSEQPTNGIKAGIYVEHLNTLTGMQVKYLISNDAPIECSMDSTLPVRFIPAFVSVSTNHILMFLAPQKSWRVDMQSSTGEAIPKTRLGGQWGEAMKVERGEPQNSGFGVLIFDSFYQGLPKLLAKDFQISDLFELKHPGDYTFKIFFCGVVATNNQFLPIYFSPVTIKLRVIK